MTIDSQNDVDPKPNCLGMSLDFVLAISVSNLVPLSFLGETSQDVLGKSLTEVSYSVLQDQF